MAANDPLTADQVEQVIRLSLPQMREAFREEVGPLAARVAEIDGRLTKVEGFHNRVAAVWSGASGLLTFAATLLWGWATGKHDQ